MTLHSGILYFDVGFNLRHAAAEYLPYAPLFGGRLLEMEPKGRFVTLVQRISRKTGGSAPACLTQLARDSAQARPGCFCAPGNAFPDSGFAGDTQRCALKRSSR